MTWPTRVDSMRKFFGLFLGGAIVLLLFAQPAPADNVYAKIRGTVTDATGAVLPDVQIIATNTATGVSKTVTSQASGLYEFLQLPIGPYTVSATKQGFKTFKSTEFILVVNQVYELEIRLEIGQISETIEVKAEQVQVETTDIQQKTVIASNQIVDMPLNGRNFTQLELLAPGVMASSDRFGTFAVNGSQTQQSSFLINGTDSNDIALNTPGLIPSPDAIAEFNLISSTINPEYGRNSGGIVNAVIKSGTNQWHGGVFDFYRDTFLNARNFFTVGPQQPIFHQNQFGGIFGGPVLKNKTFFFLSYQGTRNATATQTLTTVFSDAQRAGNFAENAKAITGNVNVTPFGIVGDDGLAHAAGQPWVPAGCVPNGFAPGCDTVFHPGSATAFNIGTGPFNSIASGLMNLFVPRSNASGNQFGFSPVNTGKTDQGIIKVDHNFNSSNQIWGLFAENSNRATQSLPFTGATLPGFGTFSTVSYTHLTLPTICSV